MEMNYDDAELHEIERELHTEILPGTEIMTDVGSHHFVKGGSGVLVPQPSDNPHDPLNWSWKWKAMAITAASFSTFIQGFGPLSLAPSFPAYIEAFNCTLTEAIQFTGIAILVLGFSNFIWVPLSTSFGRRGVYICSNLICLGSMVWRAKAQTYSSFMGACVLNGIGAGPAESIQPAVIADIFFLHDRGFHNTVYWVVYMGSLMVGPIISGVMTESVGWRNFWWFNFAFVLLTLVLVVFCFPETKWHRPHPSEMDHQMHNRAPSPPAAAYTSGASVHEKGATEQIEESSNHSLEQTKTHTAMPELALTSTAQRDPYLGKGFPSKQQFKFFQPNPTPFKSMLTDFWLPWKLFAFPIAEFAAFVVSWSCSCFLTLNLTQSQVFAVAPYNISAQNVGFMNFAILAGAAIGLATNGPFSDWVAKRQTLKNMGVREPEMRLLAMIPYVIIQFIGNVVVAVGYQHQWRWEIIVIIGFTCAGIQVAALPAIASTYAVDSYKPVAGSLFVAVTVNKNVWGYGFSKFITPWTLEAGYIKPIMTNAALSLFWCLCGLVFFYYGKNFRRWTKNSSVHKM